MPTTYPDRRIPTFKKWRQYISDQAKAISTAQVEEAKENFKTTQKEVEVFFGQLHSNCNNK